MKLRKRNKKDTIPDCFMPNPPENCEKKIWIMNNTRVIDIVICHFWCNKWCNEYMQFQENNKRKIRRKK